MPDDIGPPDGPSRLDWVRVLVDEAGVVVVHDDDERFVGMWRKLEPRGPELLGVLVAADGAPEHIVIRRGLSADDEFSVIHTAFGKILDADEGVDVHWIAAAPDARYIAFRRKPQSGA